MSQYNTVQFNSTTVTFNKEDNCLNNKLSVPNKRATGYTLHTDLQKYHTVSEVQSHIETI